MFELDGSVAPGTEYTSLAVICGVVVIATLMIAAAWEVFRKAGKPGWAVLIPIYNIIALIEVAGKPTWWFILFLIPVVNLIVAILVHIGLAEKFGKGVGFAMGLTFLPFVYLPILGFGTARYRRGPVPSVV